MRLLLDNNLSPRLVELLTLEGWDVAHVRALGLRAATDKVVLEAARNDHRVLVSADTDFGALLAASHDPPPGRGGPPTGQHRRDRGRHAPDPPPAHRLNTSVRT
jgi:hypothetical protein